MIHGRVLWFDQRNGYGVLVDDDGNEYYTDVSVFYYSKFAFHGVNVCFKANETIKHCACAKNVKLDLDHAAQLQYEKIEKLDKYENKAHLRVNARDNALDLLQEIVNAKRGEEL